MTGTDLRSSEVAGPTTGEVCLPQALRKPRLRRWEASDYMRLAHGLEIAPATLAKWATVGGGPAYHKARRVPLYPTSELDRWAAERPGGLRRNSRAEAEAGCP